MSTFFFVLYVFVNFSTSTFIQRNGSELTLNSETFIATGANAGVLPGKCMQRPTLADYSIQMDQYFKNAKKLKWSTLRFWVFQDSILPQKSSSPDFCYLDVVLSKARMYQIKLVITLENFNNACVFSQSNSTSRDPKWFDSGYLQPYFGSALSFKDYTSLIVNRYKDNTEIAIWEIMNEIHSNYYDSNNTRIPMKDEVMNFITDIAKTIKSIDSNHLVTPGVQPECYSSFPNATNLITIKEFAQFHSSSYIDVVTYHDYYDNYSNCLEFVAHASNSLKKPLLIGELNVKSSMKGVTPRSISLFKKKSILMKQNGINNFLLWIVKLVPSNQEFTLLFDSPVLRLI